MAGRTEVQAVKAFLGPLGRSIACVTRERLAVSPGGYHVAVQPHAVTLGNGDAVAIGTRTDRLHIKIAQQYRLLETTDLTGPWKVRTTSYAYSLLRRDHQEVLTFHWHPAGPSSVTTPHVHIEAGAEAAFLALTGAHIPTGRIAVEQFLRLIIDELGVKPIRTDWRKVLEKGQLDFENWQTWR